MRARAFIYYILVIFLSILSAFIFPEVVYNYAYWRLEKLKTNFWLLMVNNIAVVGFALYGGVLSSLLEIESFEHFPKPLYRVLDTIGHPFHRIFEIFMPEIGTLKEPLKSCYFLCIALPAIILSFNLFLITHLVVINYMKDITLQKSIFPLFTVEFGCLGIATFRSYKFARDNLIVFREGKIGEFRKVAMAFLKEKENLSIMVGMGLVLFAGALFEFSKLNHLP